MCTALSFLTKEHYFGRNLDLDAFYGEEVCVMPRQYPLAFRTKGTLHSHCAMIGMATLVRGTPLFYDAANEYGLAMAGLNFPGNAYYGKAREDRDNICSFELIPWVLANCKTVAEAKALLECCNIIDTPYADGIPAMPLHWIIADAEASIVVESMRDGLHVHDDPVGVLTNNPPFDYHLFNLNNYRGLQVVNSENSFAPGVALDEYCQGLGALGLPGDLSSMSRFVRAAFHKAHAVCSEDEGSSVSQFFHLLASAEMSRGACRLPNGAHDITIYSACINTARGLYYYTTYDNHQISCVDMHRENLEGDTVVHYPLRMTEQIHVQN